VQGHEQAQEAEGIRALVSDYEATFRVWGQTLSDVLIEARQAEEARRIAARYLKT
jgi:ribosomal protein L16/L10AE